MDFSFARFIYVFIYRFIIVYFLFNFFLSSDWFYHAPKKRTDNAPAKDYPAPSQIPMLSNAMIEEDVRDESGTMRGWIRESDSKYVKLAKMRGRKGTSLPLIISVHPTFALLLSPNVN